MINIFSQQLNDKITINWFGIKYKFRDQIAYFNYAFFTSYSNTLVKGWAIMHRKSNVIAR